MARFVVFSSIAKSGKGVHSAEPKVRELHDLRRWRHGFNLAIIPNAIVLSCIEIR